MAISVRLNEQEDKLIREYAELQHTTVSDLIRRIVIEKVEDEFDLQLFEAAMQDYQANPKTYTLEEAERELGLR